MIAAMLAAVALALPLAVAPMSSAQAREIPDAGLTFDEIVAWLQQKGATATLTRDGNGNQNVAAEIDGVKFGVYALDCKDDRCGSIQFAANFRRTPNITAALLNDWNREKRWGRAYVDKSGNGLWVEFDVDLTPGGSYELLDDNCDTWKRMIGDFKTFFKLS